MFSSYPRFKAPNTGGSALPCSVHPKRCSGHPVGFAQMNRTDGLCSVIMEVLKTPYLLNAWSKVTFSVDVPTINIKHLSLLGNNSTVPPCGKQHLLVN